MFFSVWTLSLYAASDELYRIDCKTDSISFFVSTSSAIFFFFQALMTWKVHKSSFALKFLQRAFISVYFGLYFLKMLHIWDSMSSFSSLKEQYPMFSAFPELFSTVRHCSANPCLFALYVASIKAVSGYKSNVCFISEVCMYIYRSRPVSSVKTLKI